MKPRSLLILHPFMFWALTSAVLLSGCMSVGPDYVVPEQ